MKEIIDLTYDMEEDMTLFDAHWHFPYQIEQKGHIEKEGRETRKVCFGTHTGTQIDAQLHFVKDGKTIEQTPLDRLMGPVTIVDFSHLENNSEVTKDMLEQITITKRMIFKFGWGKMWKKEGFYTGYPYFTPDAAQYLVDQGIQVMGFDSPSPDDGRTKLSGDLLGSEQDSPIHKILMAADVTLVEYLANLDNVTDYEGWTLVALPLRLKGADGSPARVCIFR